MGGVKTMKDMMTVSNQEALESLIDYWTSYSKQHGWEDYTPQTFINDALYSVARAINPEYQFKSGYEKFLQDLASIAIQNKIENTN